MSDPAGHAARWKAFYAPLREAEEHLTLLRLRLERALPVRPRGAPPRHPVPDAGPLHALHRWCGVMTTALHAATGYARVEGHAAGPVPTPSVPLGRGAGTSVRERLERVQYLVAASLVYAEAFCPGVGDPRLEARFFVLQAELDHIFSHVNLDEAEKTLVALTRQVDP